MQPTQTDRRDATIYDLKLDGHIRRVMIMPSPYGSDDYAVFDQATGEFVMHADDELFERIGVFRGGPSRFGLEAA